MRTTDDIWREADGTAIWGTHSSILAYGLRIGIRTNRAELLDRILAYAPPLWKPTSARQVDRLFSFRFGSGTGRPTHLLLDDYEDEIRSRSLTAILKAFQMRLRVYVAEMARRRVFVHAGSVGWRDKAIVIPGRSMSGKTSLVAELVRQGATYYSDEYAVLDTDGRVHPYPQRLEVRTRGTVKEHELPAEQIGGVTGTRPLPVSMVVVSRYEGGARWRPQRCSEGQAIMEMLANTASARRKPAIILPILQKTVSSAVVLKGVRGEAQRTAGLILERLSRE